MKLIKLMCLMFTAMLLVNIAIGCSGKSPETNNTGTEAGSTDESLPDVSNDSPSDDEISNTTVGEESPDAGSNNSGAPEKFTPKQFDNLKSPHYVSSEPANNAVLNVASEKVSIMFNFDLASNSKIEVTKDGGKVSGETVVASDKLSMSVPFSGDKTGDYSVSYVACWPDKSCHEGSFGFSVDLQ